MSTKRPRKSRKKTPELPDDLLSTQVFQAKSKAPNLSVKNVWDSRLIIENTPSGTRYDFLPGETKQVDPLDYEFLLAKERKQDQAVCCGGAGQNIPYFQGV